jgi:hypothetical protein
MSVFGHKADIQSNGFTPQYDPRVAATGWAS